MDFNADIVPDTHQSDVSEPKSDTAEKVTPTVKRVKKAEEALAA